MLSRVSLYNRIDEALGDDPRLALIAVRRLLNEELPWMEQRAVRLARSRGYKWAAIYRDADRRRQVAADEAAGTDVIAW